MNEEEIRSTIEQVKAQVKAKPENKEKTEDEIDEIILDGFFKSYTEGKMPKEDLEAIAGVMGYEFTDEFEGDQDAKSEMEPEAAAEGMSKEALEETRTIEPGEKAEDFKEKVDEVKETGDVEEGAQSSEENVEEDEDEERKKASELWKMDLSKK